MSQESPIVITDVEVEPVSWSRAALLPALRSHLGPLVPTMRRAVAVVAAAAVADWALRTGTRAVLQEGLSALGRRSTAAPGSTLAATSAATSMPQRRETLIVERVILHRSV